LSLAGTGVRRVFADAENFELARANERRKHVLDANAEASLAALKAAVLQAVLQHTRKGLTHDDVTLIALEIC